MAYLFKHFNYKGNERTENKWSSDKVRNFSSGIHLHLCIKIGGCNCAINMVLDKNHVLLFWSREVPKLVLNNNKKNT